MRIIYPQIDSSVSVIIPCECGIATMDIAIKDVPYGVPFKIVASSEVPDDMTFFAAWQADFSNPDGYGLGAQRWFIEQAEKAIAEGKNIEENIALIQRMKDEIFQIEGVQL